MILNPSSLPRLAVIEFPCHATRDSLDPSLGYIQRLPRARADGTSQIDEIEKHPPPVSRKKNSLQIWGRRRQIWLHFLEGVTVGQSRSPPLYYSTCTIVGETAAGDMDEVGVGRPPKVHILLLGLLNHAHSRFLYPSASVVFLSSIILALLSPGAK